MAAIPSFLNPFNVSNHDRLYLISPGVPDPDPVEKYMMITESLGKKRAKMAFITG